jgi:hypothetical protein
MFLDVPPKNHIRFGYHGYDRAPGRRSGKRQLRTVENSPLLLCELGKPGMKLLGSLVHVPKPPADFANKARHHEQHEPEQDEYRCDEPYENPRLQHGHDPEQYEDKTGNDQRDARKRFFHHALAGIRHRAHRYGGWFCHGILPLLYT